MTAPERTSAPPAPARTGPDGPRPAGDPRPPAGAGAGAGS